MSTGVWCLSSVLLSGPSVIERSHRPWLDLTCAFRHNKQELAEIDIKVMLWVTAGSGKEVDKRDKY